MHLADGREIMHQSRMRQPGGGGAVSTDVQPIQSCAGTFGRIGALSDELIDAGDDLFVLGYPRGISDYSAEPLWKRATVASDPRSGWNRQPQFIIDCASREGMSGAPVIAFSKSGEVQVGGMRHAGNSPSTALHGIYVGRINNPEATAEDKLFEAQLGTVWKRAVIDEIIDAEVLGLHSSEIGASEEQINEAIKAVWPQVDGYFQKVLDHQQFGWAMVHAALKHLNGNGNPNDVLNLVMQYARNLRVETKPAQ